jgi:hypothetical protein
LIFLSKSPASRICAWNRRTDDITLILRTRLKEFLPAARCEAPGDGSIS